MAASASEVSLPPASVRSPVAASTSVPPSSVAVSGVAASVRRGVGAAVVGEPARLGSGGALGCGGLEAAAASACGGRPSWRRASPGRGLLGRALGASSCSGDVAASSTAGVAGRSPRAWAPGRPVRRWRSRRGSPRWRGPPRRAPRSTAGRPRPVGELVDHGDDGVGGRVVGQLVDLGGGEGCGAGRLGGRRGRRRSRGSRAGCGDRLDVVVEGGEAGLVLAAHAGEQLVAAGDEAGVLLLHLHRLLHRQADDAHREAGQRLGQLARLVEDGGGQPGGGADDFRDLSSHGHSVPHNPRPDTRCVQIHPSRRPRPEVGHATVRERAGRRGTHLPWVHG